MIIIQEVTYRNFLASGSAPITIDFTKFPSTLITGTNGTGKSTVLDVLNFLFFGKPFRAVNKGQLVNSINGKNMLVEGKFDADGRPYRIVRGAKPNIFEIYDGDTLINQEAAMKDYQSILENQILKWNQKTFNNVVILGSASYIPFMQLPAPARREVIEDILDIKVFSAMNVLLKTKVLATKDELKSVESDIAVGVTKLESQNRVIQLAERRIKELEAAHVDLLNSMESILAEREANRLSSIAEINSRMDDNRAKRETYMADLEKRRASLIAQYEADLTANLVEIEKNNNDAQYISCIWGDVATRCSTYGTCEADLRKAREMRVQISTKVESLEEQASFFRDNTTCPTCDQAIADGHKHTVLETFDGKIGDQKANLPVLEKAIVRLEEMLVIKKGYEKELAKMEAEQNTAERRVKELTARNLSITSNLKSEQERDLSDGLIAFDQEEVRLWNKRDALEGTVVNTDDFNAKIEQGVAMRERAQRELGEEINGREEIQYQLDGLNILKGELLERRQIEDVALVLLKDNGIKTAIIQEYLPAVNKLINKYLAAMDFFVKFELSESFEEVIKSRGRDEFSYSSFSEGEKRRIDLAILFTWRQIAKMKNSVNTNLMILDEVLDGSLDANGIEFFMSIMNEFGTNSNVFVITHKVDQMIDRFDNILKFEKKGDFSVLVPS